MFELSRMGLVLMLPHKCDLVHKPAVGSLWQFILWPPGISEKKVLPWPVHPLHISYVFFVVEQQAKIKFKSWENSCTETYNVPTSVYVNGS